MTPDVEQPSETDAARAQAEEEHKESGPALETRIPASEPDCRGLGETYRIGTGVTRVGIASVSEHFSGDPLFRPLRIYTVDPGLLTTDAATAVVSVPYERLEPGPIGRLLEVDPLDGPSETQYPKVNLDDPSLLITQGIAPTPTDPRFHQQMVYAVGSLTYAAFRRALGREIEWGYTPRTGDDANKPERLILRPYAEVEENAGYSKDKGSIDFGYFEDEKGGGGIPGGLVFTSLSHDIIVHEMTHAMLDGLRAHFTVASHPDVPAFHEGFADLVAIFQHFSYREVVREGLREKRGSIGRSHLLTDLASQFGHATGGRALRTAVDLTGKVKYDKTLEVHALGSVLVTAVFDAFIDVFERKTEPLFLLATEGTGVVRPGQLPIYLLDQLAEEASKLASQFLSILIRAVDYCPPVDIRLGEYLRAIITADRDLVSDDRWRYRPAFMRAFAKFRIYPDDVKAMSEDELVWRPPDTDIRPLEELTFARLQFSGDPAHPASRREIQRQACALGRAIAKPGMAHLFGLAEPGEDIDLPCVESIRTTRRVGPDGGVVFDLVAEVTQRRTIAGNTPDESSFDYLGGATIIVDPAGRVRYVIRKSVNQPERLAEQRAYLGGPGGRYWSSEDGHRVPVRNFFRLVHGADR